MAAEDAPVLLHSSNPALQLHLETEDAAMHGPEDEGEQGQHEISEDVDQEGDEEEVDEEEEEAEQEEDDDEEAEAEAERREFGIYQCLPVDDAEPDWESGEAATVEEYLRRVRYEARQLPEVVARRAPELQQQQQHGADAPHTQRQQQRQREQGEREHYSRRYLAADPGVPACHPRLQPSATWTRDFLQQFAQLRRRLHREFELTSGQATAVPPPGVSLRLSPHLVVRGGGGLDAAAAQELAALSSNPPSALIPELQQLAGLDQLQVRRQLHSAVRQAVRPDGALTAQAAAQLYALSARIEKPLHAGTCALYRELLRKCAARRATLGAAPAAESGAAAAAAEAVAAAAADPLLPHLNILIIIAGAYFGQDEELATMWDDDEE